jgi:hypothetical protein
MGHSIGRTVRIIFTATITVKKQGIIRLLSPILSEEAEFVAAAAQDQTACC